MDGEQHGTQESAGAASPVHDGVQGGRGPIGRKRGLQRSEQTVVVGVWLLMRRLRRKLEAADVERR